MSLALPRIGRVQRSKRSALGPEAREIRFGRLLMIPALVAPVCLSVVFLAGVWVTLNNWRLTTGNLGFVGLANYGKVLSDPKFWHSALLTLKFTALDITTELVVATLMALALNEALRGIRFYRSLLILPLMTPPVVGALVWKVLFRSGTGGFFNFILWKMGIPGQGSVLAGGHRHLAEHAVHRHNSAGRPADRSPGAARCRAHRRRQ
jgi:multiple sugar transport system permease protein